MEPAALLVLTCSSFASKLNAVAYNDMQQEVPFAWAGLRCRKTKQHVKVDESAGSDEETKPEKRWRLDLDTLLKHFRSKGACGTFMVTTCDAQLEDGSKSRLLYIIPKYDLNAAIERRDDMFAAMPLCLARSEAEVEPTQRQAGQSHNVFCPIQEVLLLIMMAGTVDKSLVSIESETCSLSFSCIARGCLNLAETPSFHDLRQVAIAFSDTSG